MHNPGAAPPASPPRVLIGGVPFGCHNVGDEAILECTLQILREINPEAHLTVATADGPGTREKHQVQTCELLGFHTPAAGSAARRVLRQHDLFLWGGATGLSDYPRIPLELTMQAHRLGLRTVLWGVGMNNVLNPTKFRVLPGRRRRLLSLIQKCTLNRLDAIRLTERRWERNIRRKIARCLNRVDLLIVRDEDSRSEIQRSGVEREILIGADSALDLRPAGFDALSLPAPVRAALNSPLRKVGVCISTSAPQFHDIGQLILTLNDLARDDQIHLVFLPMDPVVDARLMKDIQQKLAHPRRSTLIEGRFDPGQLLALVSRLDVVISSRLHLIILASIAETPFVGISPGSKLDSFMLPYGLKPAGTVTHCDFAMLQKETRRLLKDPDPVLERMRAVQRELLERLATAKSRLKTTLDGLSAPAC